MLTWSGAEKTKVRQGIEGNQIIDRLRSAIPCTTIVVAREQHETLGHNSDIGIFTDGIQRKRIKE